MNSFSIVVAMDEHRGIGINGQLPWQLSADLKHFKNITTQTQDPQKKNIVVMGRKTWESLPEKFRPLPNRINIVLTRDAHYSLPESVIRCESFSDLERVLARSDLASSFEKVFIIGGEGIFTQALKLPECNSLVITHLLKSFKCDTFFPAFEPQFKLVSKSPVNVEGEISYFFAQYQRS